MASSEILREYLVRLGYETDAVSYRQMMDGLCGTTKKIMGVSLGLVGITAATATATAAFAYNMRKMYFASELAGSSVKNLRAMEYAGKQIGVSGDAMASAIHDMGQALRLEPGLQAYLQNMGIQVTGRDVSDVMVDLVSALKNMPEFQATQIAGMFGISPDDYHQMVTHLDDLKARKEEHLKMAKDMNVDVDKAKATNMEYTATLDKMAEKFELLSDKILIKLTPAFRDLAKETDNVMDGLSYGLDNLGVEWDSYTKEVKKDFAAWNFGIPTKTEVKQGYEWLKDMSSNMGLPDWLLPSVAHAESNFNPNAKSKAGAMGLMQFMPDTAKRFGIKNPWDATQSAEGAGKYYQKLLSMYSGNVGYASAAYNWGEGNMNSWLKTGRGAKGQVMPGETWDYVQKVTGHRLGEFRNGNPSNITQNNTYNISGESADSISKSVATQNKRDWANVQRNMSSVVK